MIRLRTDLFDEFPTVIFYDADGNCLGETNNPIIIDDFRSQIKEQQAEGYYMVYENEKIPIDKNGTPYEFPDVCNMYSDILVKLI